MAESKCTILCSARCKYNSDSGYYSICHHPDAGKGIYSTIDRLYLEGCANEEKRERSSNEADI